MRTRVIHILTTGINSGAGKSVLLLHRSLLKLGWDSRVLVYGENHQETGFISLTAREKWCWRLAVVLERLMYYGFANRNQVRRFHFHSPLFGLSLHRIKAVQEADIVHLHWAAAAGVKWKQLSHVTKPLVWTFRDYWPMTGLCHFPGTCMNLKQGCGHCPKLKRPNAQDLSYRWAKKKQEYLPTDTVGVAISQFQFELAQQSSIWNGNRLSKISNGIDTQKWGGVSREQARNSLNLPLNRRVLTFGSLDFYEPHKGFPLLRQLTQRPEWSDCLWLFFGTVDEEGMKELGVEYRNMGIVKEDHHMQMIYASANVFVAPFYGEPFGKAILECMAAGTGCVAYADSGASDTIVDGATGVLMNTHKTEDWVSAINWVMEVSNDQDFIKANQNQASKFDIETVTNQYTELYKSMLHGN